MFYLFFGNDILFVKYYDTIEYTASDFSLQLNKNTNSSNTMIIIQKDK